jgi:hypothetical protein
VLSDLLPDARARPFFLEWRSPRDASVTLPGLLLAVWAELDRARGISDAAGLLASTERPLALGSVCRSSGVSVGNTGSHSGGSCGELPPSLAATLAGAADEARFGGAPASTPGVSSSPGPAVRLLRSAERGRAGSAAYGLLLPERRRLVERFAAACDGDALMDKVR